MTPRQIIAKAWAITTKEKQLWQWGCIAAIFETLRTLELFLYQGYYLYSFTKGETVGWLSVEMLFFQSLPLWLFILGTVLLIVLLVCQLFIPTLAEGAVIGLAAKSYTNKEVKGGFILGMYNFFPILEIHGFFILSSFSIALAAGSMLLRYGGDPGFIASSMSILIFLWVFAVIFRFFASFAEEAVVIRKLGAFAAVARSFKLVVSNVSHLMFLLLLLVVISLRIVINTALVILVPAITIGLGWLLTFILSPTISYIIGSIIGLALLIVASYFFAYLTVFKQTVWTLTFMELDKQKDLDIIH